MWDLVWPSDLSEVSIVVFGEAWRGVSNDVTTEVSMEMFEYSVSSCGPRNESTMKRVTNGM
jgi:hypothetical protein